MTVQVVVDRPVLLWCAGRLLALADVCRWRALRLSALRLVERAVREVRVS